jgi:hypothetical protein
MADLTAEEKAHQKSLETLLESMRGASADPATSIQAREALGPQIAGVLAQIDEVEKGVFSRGTHTIMAQEQVLAPALAMLQNLKTELAKVTAGIKTAAEIAGDVDTAITTCESLLG